MVFPARGGPFLHSRGHATLLHRLGPSAGREGSARAAGKVLAWEPAAGGAAERGKKDTLARKGLLLKSAKPFYPYSESLLLILTSWIRRLISKSPKYSVKEVALIVPFFADKEIEVSWNCRCSALRK